VRRVLSGEFTVVNQHLLMDLTALGLWNPDMKNELVAANGSVSVRARAPATLPRLRPAPAAQCAAGPLDPRAPSAGCRKTPTMRGGAPQGMPATRDS